MPDAMTTTRKAGAPIANRNAVRHGLRAGALPKGAAYIKRDTEKYRRFLEDAVEERHGGEVSIFHAGVIQSAVRWERHAMLCQRWLRLEAENMDQATRLAYSRDIARGSSERDRCWKELGLDKSPAADDWPALVTAVATPTPATESDRHQDARSEEKKEIPAFWSHPTDKVR